MLLIASAVLISACGAGSSKPPATTASQSAAGQGQSGAATGQSAVSGQTSHTGAQPPRKVAGGDIVSNDTTVQRPMRGTGGNEINDDNPGKADTGNGSATGLNPCTLVPRAEVQAIIGEPIGAPEEAPLGPTCIYQPTGAKTSITLTVESIDFAKIKPLVHKQIHLTIAGHTAYCGVYGRATTFVPLSKNRVLNIAAPCSVGTKLAQQALPGLKHYS